MSHNFKDTVIPDEFKSELEWARSRRLSCAHAFGDTDSPDDEKALQTLIDHYSIERVSKAKDCVFQFVIPLIFFLSLLVPWIPQASQEVFIFQRMIFFLDVFFVCVQETYRINCCNVWLLQSSLTLACLIQCYSVSPVLVSTSRQ